MSTKYEEQLEEKILKLEGKLAKVNEINENRTKFLGNISHETITPLNSIAGFINILKEEVNHTEQYMNIVENSSKELLILMKDLGDIIKIDSGELRIQKEYFSIKKLLSTKKTIFETRAKNKGLDFVLKENEDIEIYSDPNRVSQITSNLIKNAIKFTDKGRIELNYELEGDYLNISIKDTGSGIPKKEQNKLFERYEQFTSNKKGNGGSGIGLHLVKELTEKLEGKLNFESEYKEGTTFTVSLPIKKYDEIKQEEKENNKDILLVEPDDINAILVDAYLKKEDEITIHHAANSEEAKKMFSEKEYSLVIMDTVLNGNTTGWDLTEQFKKTKETPIIIYTHLDRPTTERKMKISSADDYLIKPATTKKFISKIKEYI